MYGKDSRPISKYKKNSEKYSESWVLNMTLKVDKWWVSSINTIRVDSSANKHAN